jgi:uncharacterized membrane protein YbaN (DUF454 family)
MGQPHPSPWVRWLFLGLGLASLALAVLGVFLPILPTTPLVLLAAAFFARGSSRLHHYLLHHKIFGPIIQDWEEHRSMPPGVKPWAFTLLAISFAASIYAVESTTARIALAVLGLVLALFLWRVPVRVLTPEEEARREASP